jgi:hypothetical protein
LQFLFSSESKSFVFVAITCSLPLERGKKAFYFCLNRDCLAETSKTVLT